jgi:hypothetical protein
VVETLVKREEEVKKQVMAEMTTPVVEKMTVKAEETAPEEDKK